MVHEMLLNSAFDGYTRLDDASLVSLFKAGDTEAFEELVGRYQDTYVGIARRIVGDKEAQDVVQDAMINVFRKIHTFTGEGSFKGWSCRIVVNCGRMLLRKYARRQEVSAEYFEAEVEEQAWPDSKAYNSQLGELIHEAIEGLDPMYAEIIKLREFEGLSMSEMSEVLNITTGGVKTRLHRARAFLRIALEPHLAA